MGMKMRLIQCLSVGFILMAGTSCSLLRGGPPSHTAAASDTVAQSGVQDKEAKLRALVREHIQKAAQSEEAGKALLIDKKPYFFKEYENFPDGAEAFKVLLQKTETRSKQYVAEVRLNKIRYATRLHRNKKDAQHDNSFLRSTGVETMTYEFRNGHWVRIGTLFIASKGEENINGEWIPLKEEVPAVIPKDSPAKKRGWLHKSWFWITGR